MAEMMLISHGKLADGMKNSLELVAGKSDKVHSFGLESGMHPDMVVAEMEQMIERRPEVEYIIVGDLMGGSLCNSAVRLTERDNVHLIYGMNLGLVVSIYFALEQPVYAAGLNGIIDECKKGICLFNRDEAKSGARNEASHEDGSKPGNMKDIDSFFLD